LKRLYHITAVFCDFLKTILILFILITY